MQGSVESLGTLLRREREQHQVSLQDISATTKIQLKFLEAIERDEYERLPPAPFAVGFLRAYAQCIGLDPEEVVGAYYALRGGGQRTREQRLFGMEQVQQSRRTRRVGIALIGVAVLLVVGMLWYLPPQGDDTGASMSSSVAAGSRPTATARNLAAESPTLPTPSTSPASSSQGISPVATAPPVAPRRVETSTVNTAAAGDEATPAAAHAASEPSERLGAGSPFSAPAEPKAVVSTAEPPLASKPAARAAPPGESPVAPAGTPGSPGPLIVEVEAIADTWLEVEVDGERQRPFTLESGRSERWQATERVVLLTIGNAAGTRVTLNGREVSLPSPRSNIARNIVLTRDLVH
jgi:cytoskeleton protein RodZ